MAGLGPSNTDRKTARKADLMAFPPILIVILRGVESPAK
jgi:hypothetical protein